MTDTSNELLPCPFCGGGATVAKASRGWKVECEGRMGSCYINARTHYQPHRFLAVDAWNTRPAITPQQAAKVRHEAVEALASYQQADMDGVMVLVSRQAIEECLPALRAIAEQEQDA